jgi:cell division septation protein DedD
MTRAVTLALALALGMAAAPAIATASAAAQSPGLDRADSLIAAAAYDQARAVVQEWWAGRDATSAPGAERARALMLRARLAPDPASAESDYLAIVLGYPASPQAPQALLRLGQGLLISNEAARAAGYLQRLVIDYPGRAERTHGLLWLARASYAARQTDAACQAAREGLRDSRDPDMIAMLRVEEAGSCSPDATRPSGLAQRPSADPPAAEQRQAAPPPASAQPVAAPPLARPPVVTPPVGIPTTTAPVTPAATGRWAVQTGAFRYQQGVDDLVARLRRAGHDPRVALVPANDLIRVRLGRFETAADAARLVARLKTDGFDAVVVADADRERQP